MRMLIYTLLIALLYACGGGAGASDPDEAPFPFEGLWNWTEIKTTDEGVSLYFGNDTEVCMGDVIINHDGTCQMSERCIRESGRFSDPVYTVDCEWKQINPQMIYLRMYAPDRSWYQEFIAIGSQDGQKATVTRTTAGRVSYLNAYRSDTPIADSLGDIPLCGQEYCPSIGGGQ